MSDKPRILQRPDDIRNPKPRRGDSPAAERDEKAHAEFARKWLEASRLKKLQDRFDYIAEGCRILLRSFQLPDHFGQFLVCGDAWEAAEADLERRQTQADAIYERVQAPLREAGDKTRYLVNSVRHPALIFRKDSYQHAAATLLDHCDYARELLAEGSDTAEAMRIALEIGTRAATLAILRRWESDALAGEHLRTDTQSKGGKAKAIAEEVKRAVLSEHRRRLVDHSGWAGRKKKAAELRDWVLRQQKAGDWSDDERMPSVSLIEKWLRK